MAETRSSGSSGREPGGVHDRPRLRHNDYSPLVPPPLGGWTPTLTVSVVVPAHGAQHRLDLTLAALAAQTYPSGLMEVVVVDDGSRPPLRLPEIRPERTRLVRAAPGGWGASHALNSGVTLAEGDVVQRLDADMVTGREHIEALMRWHHLADYLVTIGAKSFVEEPELTPAQVHAGVRAGALDTLFDLERAVPSSTEATIRRLDGLRASKNPYHVATGPTVSFRRALFHRLGGFDTDVLRGQDTEFAYRLAMSGAVFVPDPEARAVHLGLPAQRVDGDAIVRVVSPFLAHRVPLRRDLRKEPGRRWKVPYVEVVLDAAGRGEPEVRAAVSAALSGSVPDVRVTLTGPWAELPAGRHPLLGDPGFEARLIREQFQYDDAVHLVSTPAPDAAPVPFRYTGPVDVPLGRRSLELMIKAVTEDRSGLLLVGLPGGRTARLERTDAVNRARLLAGPGEDLTEVVAQTHGVRRAQAAEFWPPAPQRGDAASSARRAAAAPQDQPAAGRGGTAPQAPGPASAAPASSRSARDALMSRLRSAIGGR
ncbi:glycosyltransferase [Sphaerisporangium sp. TRM90804]|uniref:glycosyltransferase n=1 Tax=Sphaerisporangium sp. TRM90804 TaxID=3031113 RepID=UPI00244C731F|nr:glycosyltransferase [Sphaerisporangium sp. TRM90804]MDH2428106.1 glycosyltransferase [Sphaerisporangium sp. TRM90804]